MAYLFKKIFESRGFLSDLIRISIYYWSDIVSTRIVAINQETLTTTRSIWCVDPKLVRMMIKSPALETNEKHNTIVVRHCFQLAVMFL